jgi:putative phosphoribosyl transferase
VQVNTGGGISLEADLALRREIKLVIVPGATHLFEGPGALEQVVQLACDWFVRYLPPCPTPTNRSGRR